MSNIYNTKLHISKHIYAHANADGFNGRHLYIMLRYALVNNMKTSLFLAHIFVKKIVNFASLRLF